MTELVLGLCSERHVQHGISGSVREHVPAHAEARLCKSTFEELSWGRTSPPKPCSLQVQPRQSSRNGSRMWCRGSTTMPWTA